MLAVPAAAFSARVWGWISWACCIALWLKSDAWSVIFWPKVCVGTSVTPSTGAGAGVGVGVGETGIVGNFLGSSGISISNLGSGIGSGVGVGLGVGVGVGCSPTYSPLS